MFNENDMMKSENRSYLFKLQAEEMGFSPEEIKGLVFMLGYTINASQDQQIIANTLNLFFESDSGDQLENRIQDYNESKVQQYFEEYLWWNKITKEQLNLRVIFQHKSGNKRYIIEPKNHGLMNFNFKINEVDHFSIHVTYEQLLRGIGCLLDEPIDSIFCSGFNLFSVHAHMDTEGTMALVSKFYDWVPPLYGYFLSVPKLPIDNLIKSSPIDRINLTFIGGLDPEIGKFFWIAQSYVMYGPPNVYRKKILNQPLQDYFLESEDLLSGFISRNIQHFPNASSKILIESIHDMKFKENDQNKILSLMKEYWGFPLDLRNTNDVKFNLLLRSAFLVMAFFCHLSRIGHSTK